MKKLKLFIKIYFLTDIQFDIVVARIEYKLVAASQQMKVGQIITFLNG